eukprot:scaffold2246_cov162-Amphora_coffeaeformis.AAC.20
MMTLSFVVVVDDEEEWSSGHGREAVLHANPGALSLVVVVLNVRKALPWLINRASANRQP